ncbi:MAG: ABC transporter permease [Bryobacteraceae bacterium]|nr:ABC transporter permease [Bryobacteraceae bacterium]
MPNLPGRRFFRNLVERRALLYQLIRRDFEKRFVGSAGGWLWGLVHPLVLLASWTFVFHICLRMGVPEGSGTSNYTLFLFCGYLPWMLFSETVQRSATAIVDSSNLVTKTVFPSEMIPISIFFSTLVSHWMTLGLALAAIQIWGGGLWWTVLWLPLAMAALALLSIGVGWIVAAFQVYLRDTAQGVMVALTLWFWITPIFINLDQIPASLRVLPALNPLSALVRIYRDVLLSGAPPRLADMTYAWAVSSLVFLAGALIFRQLKRGFADVL